MQNSQLHHIAIYTGDIEKSLAFYTTVLHAEILWDGESMLPAGKVHAAMLKIGNFQLELVVPLLPWDQLGQRGPIQHFALRVDNLPETMRHAENTRLAEKIEPTSRLVAFGKIMDHAFLYGPDGERIELVQEL